MRFCINIVKKSSLCFQGFDYQRVKTDSSIPPGMTTKSVNQYSAGLRFFYFIATDEMAEIFFVHISEGHSKLKNWELLSIVPFKHTDKSMIT